MVDFRTGMAKPRSSAHSLIFDEWAELHMINVRVGTENSEVISIWACEKVVGYEECGDKQVE